MTNQPKIAELLAKVEELSDFAENNGNHPDSAVRYGLMLTRLELSRIKRALKRLEESS